MIYIYIHIYVNIYTHTYTRIYMNIYIHAYMCVTHICVSVRWVVGSMCAMIHFVSAPRRALAGSGAPQQTEKNHVWCNERNTTKLDTRPRGTAVCCRTTLE